MTAARLLGAATTTIARIAATTLAAYAAASLVRDGLVARDDLGALCQAVDAPWWCRIRQLLIVAFLNQAFSAASATLAALAAWRRRAWAAYLAIVVGVTGMVLWDYRWSVVGVLGGALVLARLQGEWQQHAEPQRHG